MGNIGLILLVFCAALAGLIYLSNIYTRFCINRIVVRKMEWLDFVQDTGLAPAEWRARYEKAMAKLPPGDDLKLRKIKEKAKENYFKRMDGLMRFAKVCTLVQSETERAGIIRILESVRQEWRENDDALFTNA
jgi:hypothetical protein